MNAVPVGAAVEVRVELVGAEESEALVVVDVEAVGEFPGVAAEVEFPLPIGKETAEIARLGR